VGVNETGEISRKHFVPQAILKSDGVEEEEGECNNVRDLDPNQAASEVIFYFGAVSPLEVVGGKGEG
jgi:hypothetical protein